VRDPECAAFGYGRRSVNATYSPTYYTLINSSPAYVLEDTLPTTRYTRLYPVFSRYMTSNHQLTNKEIPSSSNLSSPPDPWRKYIQSNMQVTDSWNHFDSTGTPFPLNVLSNLERLRPKRWFVILSMKKINDWQHCWILMCHSVRTLLLVSMNIICIMLRPDSPESRNCLYCHCTCSLDSRLIFTAKKVPVFFAVLQVCVE
jgi:hypothetical protein